jgi:Tol biopolymer transport system component
MEQAGSPGAMPNWSPDGKLLVCHTYGTPPEPDHVVVMNADGSGRETLVNHWGSARWSRRSDQIVSILNGNLALFNSATGEERPILPRSYPINIGFGVSPDGKRFCFSGYDQGLFLATLTSETAPASVRLLLNGGRGQYASFAPDGKRVVFSWNPAGTKSFQLYTLDVDGDAKPKHLDGQDESKANWAPNWSPDGKTIIFASKPVVR